MKSRSKGQTIAYKVVVIHQRPEGISQFLKEKIQKIVREVKSDDCNVKEVEYNLLETEFQFKAPLVAICMPEVFTFATEIEQRWPSPVEILALQNEKHLEEQLRNHLKLHTTKIV